MTLIELHDNIYLGIRSLPIGNANKNYYLDFLNRTVYSPTLSDEEKLRKLRILLQAVEASHHAAWLNSPLGFCLGWIELSVTDVGQRSKDVLNSVQELVKAKNLIPILLLIVGLVFLLKVYKK